MQYAGRVVDRKSIDRGWWHRPPCEVETTSIELQHKILKLLEEIEDIPRNCSYIITLILRVKIVKKIARKISSNLDS